MIRELSIKNLALVDRISVDLEQGFSVFTGETGTGKSILIGAIGLLLGDRASNEHIRSGAEEAEVCGLFEWNPPSSDLVSLLNHYTIPFEENTLIIRRTITRNGRNRIYVNQIPLPLATLKTIGNHLIDFQSQHEHQSLLRHETAMVIINNLPEVTPLWKKFISSYSAFQSMKKRLDDFDISAQELMQTRDFVEFQYNEFTQLSLQPNEESELEQEYTHLSSVTQRLDCISSINRIIEGNQEYQGLERQIRDIKKNLEILQKYDASAAPWIADIENTLTYFSELNAYCLSYLENEDKRTSPARLEEINFRLAKIQRLKKKYQCSFPELLQKQDVLKEKLAALENMTLDRNDLEKQYDNAFDMCKQAAERLSDVRKKATEKFDERISQQMGKLGFSGGMWRTEFVPCSEITAHGLESIVFMVQTNSGEPLLPLNKTASGGEISRLMLAIKSVLTSYDSVPILIFDEIDTGIGGQVAKEVARCLYALSRSHQVLCISHLHQIASVADHHYRVFKKSENNRTVVRVTKLNAKEKVDEITRMLGSDSEISKKHAEELLSKGNLNR